METLSEKELRQLMDTNEPPAVSVYIPTHRTGDIQQDRIRLKNVLGELERGLTDYGLRSTEAQRLLDPAQRLLPDGDFWQHQADGLAILLSPSGFRYYRLPWSFSEFSLVGDHFYLKPLLPLLAEDGFFYILALSQNRVRLLQCTRDSVNDVTPVSLPSSLAEALRYDEPEKQHQFHTTGQGPAIFHGQGVSKDYDKVAILRYFQQLDRGLHNVLKDSRFPLILAAVDYLHAIYQQANTYGNLLLEGLTGNFDTASDQEIHDRAWDIAARYFDSCRQSALKRYEEGVGKGLTTNDIGQTVLAAYDGRVDTLFVAANSQQWGRFDPLKREVSVENERTPDSQELLDLAALHTLSNKGAAYVVDADLVPGETGLAAVLRY